MPGAILDALGFQSKQKMELITAMPSKFGMLIKLLALALVSTMVARPADSQQFPTSGQQYQGNGQQFPGNGQPFPIFDQPDPTNNPPMNGQQSLTGSQPNIVFIFADDMGFNDVGFHGSTQVKTPNLDMYASQGIILENYYTQALCTPSRSALLTGRYPIHIGMQHSVILCTEPWGLDPAQKILPEYLKDLGYATHMVGKWHQGFFLKKYTPTYRGFDTYAGHYFNSDYWTHQSLSSERNQYGADYHENVGPTLDTTNYNATNGSYITDLYTQRAVQQIQNHNTSQPFFLYLAHWATHGANPPDPLQATPDRLALFANVNHTQRAKYLGMLKALDDSVGAVMAAITAKGWANNTIVVFAADNGGPTDGFMNNYATNWPLSGGKNTMWEGGIRASAFLWSAQLNQTGYRSHHMMHVSDWVPTLVNRAAQMPLPNVANSTTTCPRHTLYRPLRDAKLDGFDMWPALSGGISVNSPRNEILHQYDQIYGWGALRMGDWKLIINETAQTVHNQPGQHLPPGDPNPTSVVNCGNNPPSNASKYQCLNMNSSKCLYNVKMDPCELTNLATDMPDQVALMMARFAVYQAETLQPRNRPFDPCANADLFNGAWVNWLDFTGGEAYESQLPYFNSTAQILAFETLSMAGTPCPRNVTGFHPAYLTPTAVSGGPWTPIASPVEISMFDLPDSASSLRSSSIHLPLAEVPLRSQPLPVRPLPIILPTLKG